MFHPEKYPLHKQIKVSQHASESFEGKSSFLEFIQNALDARADESEPVEVKFILEKTKEYDEDFLDFNRIKKTYEEDNNIMSDLQFKNLCKIFNDGKISYSIFEDYNTTGLVGSQNDNQIFDNMSSFNKFWHTLFDQNKTDGNKDGSVGVGKSSYNISSNIRTFFGLSNSEDLTFRGLSFLEGMGIYDAWVPYGMNKEGTEGTIYPYRSDSEKLKKFVDFFSLANRKNKKGFSVVIIGPENTNDYDDEEKQPSSVELSIIKIYAIPILKKELKIRIVKNNGEEILIDSESIVGIAKENPEADEYVKMCIHLLNSVDSSLNDPYDYQDNKQEKKYKLYFDDTIRNKEIDDEELKSIKSKLYSGDYITFKTNVPREVLKKNSRGFDISKYPLWCIIGKKKYDESFQFFSTGNLMLPKFSIESNNDYSIMFWVQKGNELFKVIKSLENGNHDNLNSQSSRFKRLDFNNIIFPRKLISHLNKTIPNNFYKLLFDMDDEERKNDNYLSEIFSFPTNANKISSNKNSRKKKKNANPVQIVTNESPKQWYEYFTDKNNIGFLISHRKDIEIKKSSNPQFETVIEIQSGIPFYSKNSIVRNPWKKHKKEDFVYEDTETFSYEVSNCDVYVKGNKIYIRNILGDFSLKVIGFDENLDIHSNPLVRHINNKVLEEEMKKYKKVNSL